MADIYDGIFRTIIHDCKTFVLPLLNEVFGESYQGNEEIMFHPNERFLDQQDAPDIKRITDTNFTVKGIESKTYHLECESSPYSNKIMIRLFEYDAQIALDTSYDVENNELLVKFPHTSVIYLRDTSTTPDFMTVRINTPGTDAAYQIPIVKLCSYSIDEIFDKRLYILVPFYIFNSEKDFKKNKESIKFLKSLQAIYDDIFSRLESLVNQGVITAFDQRTIIELTRDCVKELTNKYEYIQKGIGVTMAGALINTETRSILNQGISQGISQVAKEMILNSEPLAKIQKYTALSIDAIQSIAKELGKTLVQ